MNASKECVFRGSSLEAISSFMYDFAQATLPGQEQFVCARLPYVTSKYPHYVIGNRVFMVRPRPGAQLSTGLVAVDCQAVLLGIDAFSKKLYEHPIGLCLADLRQENQSATEACGCSVHRGVAGMIRHCDFDFNFELVAQYLPTAGCNVGC